MLLNAIKTGIRDFRKHPFDWVTNILGLTIGLAGCLLIGLFILDELRFDRFIPDGDRIFRVYNERTGADGVISHLPVVSPALAPTLAKDFPEVETTLRMAGIFFGSQLFKLGDKAELERNGLYAEASFFDFFPLDLIEGDPSKALAGLNSVVLTEPLARRWFGNGPALGRTLTIEGREATVTGVMRVPPRHFHLDFAYLISFESGIRGISPARMSDWVWQQFFTYVKLRTAGDGERLAAKLPAFSERHAWPVTKPRGFSYIPFLQPLEKIHLHSSGFVWEIARRGDIAQVRALAAVGVFLLLIAVINFVNLSTATASRRAREVGLRKVTGARRGQIAAQFLSQAVLTAAAAVVLAFWICSLVLPSLNKFTGKQMTLAAFPIFFLVGGAVAAAFVVGFLAGVYPAFVLSAFHPAQVFRGSVAGEGRGGRGLRSGLVVVQFALSVLLIISAVVIERQVNFLHSKPLGFDRNLLLSFNLRGDMASRYETVKAEFLRVPGVRAATAAYGIPGDIIAGDEIHVPGREANTPARMFVVDHDYVTAMALELRAGRGFSREFATDADEAFLINETAVQDMGLGTPEEAVGRPLEWSMWGRPGQVKKGRVVGVIRDFHYDSLRQKVGTVVLHIYPASFRSIILRVRGENLDKTLAGIRAVWDGFGTGYPFGYTFVDDGFEAMYRSEERLRTVAAIFTGLAIFVSCLGLLGLAAFVAKKRTKEIGIRKVLGASTPGILGLLTLDFLKPVAIAVALASPVAWMVMRSWQADFAYRAGIGAGPFLLAGAAAALIAVLTVGFHAFRAAQSDPVKAIKYE